MTTASDVEGSGAHGIGPSGGNAPGARTVEPGRRAGGPPRHEARSAPRASAWLALIGVIGELLITAGVVLAGYVAWELWWDSAAASREGQQAVQEFWDSVPEAPRTAAPVQSPDDDPPVMEPVGYGETFGVLIVPRWKDLTDNAMPIREGTGPDVLDQAAAGHWESSAMPGDVGNMTVFGHRRTKGNSFRYIDRLQVGDPIVVETADTWYIYEVTDWELVTPDRIDVTYPVPGDAGAVPTERILTLVTCHSTTLGEYGNDHRWVTRAHLVGWMDRSEGTPDVLLDDAEVK